MKGPNQHSESVLAEINIIPFVDIVLVLLIIFMVAAPLLQQGVDVKLPEVSAENVKTSKEDFVVSIKKDGSIYLGSDKKTSYKVDELESKLKSIFSQKDKKELYLRADSSLDYGKVVKIMAICQKAGVENIGMITVPDNKS